MIRRPAAAIRRTAAKIKGTIHWVDAHTALPAEVRLYDNLFTVADPDAADRNFLECI